MRTQGLSIPLTVPHREQSKGRHLGRRLHPSRRWFLVWSSLRSLVVSPCSSLSLNCKVQPFLDSQRAHLLLSAPLSGLACAPGPSSSARWQSSASCVDRTLFSFLFKPCCLAGVLPFTLLKLREQGWLRPALLVLLRRLHNWVLKAALQPGFSCYGP